MTAELPTPDRDAGRRRRPAPTRRPRCSRSWPTRTSPARQAIIRRYDHEILGATVVRPLVGVARRRSRRRRRARRSGATPTASPSASASTRGTACSTRSAMAHAVVDEAIRNVVAVGADPDRVALLDNFSWGDPRRPTTLGDLVAAVQRLLRRGDRLRRAVRQRQGLAEQRVPRRRRHAPRRPADARHHRGRPRARRRRGGHPRPEATPATCSCSSARHVPSSAAATSTMVTGARQVGVGARPPTPTHPPATGGCTRPSATAGSSPATTSAKAASPSRSPRCASAAASAPTIDALPDADPVAALFSESTGRFVVEVAARRRAVSPSCSASAHVHRCRHRRARAAFAAAGSRRRSTSSTPSSADVRSGRDESRPPALVLRGAGHQPRRDAAFALDLAGAETTHRARSPSSSPPAAARRGAGCSVRRRRVQLRRRARRRPDVRPRARPSASATSCARSSTPAARDRHLQRLPGADAHRPAARRWRVRPQRQRPLRLPLGHTAAAVAAAASGPPGIDDRSTARSPTARAASSPRARWRRSRPAGPDRARATPAATRTARSTTSPASATRPASCSG